MILFDLTVAVSGVPDVISCMILFDLTVAVSGDPDVILMHDLV